MFKAKPSTAAAASTNANAAAGSAADGKSTTVTAAAAAPVIPNFDVIGVLFKEIEDAKLTPREDGGENDLCVYAGPGLTRVTDDAIKGVLSKFFVKLEAELQVKWKSSLTPTAKNDANLYLAFAVNSIVQSTHANPKIILQLKKDLLVAIETYNPKVVVGKHLACGNDLISQMASDLRWAMNGFAVHGDLKYELEKNATAWCEASPAAK